MKPQFLFIGLGNPGATYENTRHNAGWLFLDRLTKDFAINDWHMKDKFMSLIAEGAVGNAPIFLVKPTTYMNRSGEAIKKMVDFYKLDPSRQILVCCDDVDLERGTFRLRMDGGPGTHNGLRSVVDTIGEGFARLRFGLGPQPEQMDLAAWVTSALSDAELRSLQHAFEAAVPEAKKHIEKLSK